MPLSLPLYVSVVFLLTVFLCLWLFQKALPASALYQKKTSGILYGLFGWIILQVVLTRMGIYSSNPDAMPPLILVFGVFPPIVLILLVFVTKKGRIFLDQFDPVHLHYLHVVRIPVELTLYWLYLNHTVPELMTFEGRNFDIVAGITAPIVAYVGLVKQRLNRRLLIAWNLLCLGLLLNIVIHAALSAPFPLQLLAFDQPNIAILYFPYSLLPTFIVPVVLFCHLVSIRNLSKAP